MDRVRKRVPAGLLLLALSAGLPACGPAEPSGTEQDPPRNGAGGPPRDAAAPIQTDAPGYDLVWDGRGWGATIPFQFTNPSADTLYAVNCNGAIAVAVERREGTEWSSFWVPMMNACLSPPIVIPPGQVYRDSVDLWGAPPGGNVAPAFPNDDLEGDYRLVWTNLVLHYDDRVPGFGDTVPSAYRYSNDFHLETRP